MDLLFPINKSFMCTAWECERGSYYLMPQRWLLNLVRVMPDDGCGAMTTVDSVHSLLISFSFCYICADRTTETRQVLCFILNWTCLLSLTRGQMNMFGLAANRVIRRSTYQNFFFVFSALRLPSFPFPNSSSASHSLCSSVSLSLC